MSENRRSEGILVTLTNVTAASNLNGGDPIAVLTGTNQIFTLGLSTTGFSCTALAGFHFLGILDQDVSAGEQSIPVWTEGVFELVFSSALTTAYIGTPVFPDSGTVVSDGTTGQGSVGTVVGLRTVGEQSGQRADVKINPLAYRFDRYVPANTASAVFGVSWPIITH